MTWANTDSTELYIYHDKRETIEKQVLRNKSLTYPITSAVKADNISMRNIIARNRVLSAICPCLRKSSCTNRTSHFMGKIIASTYRTAMPNVDKPVVTMKEIRLEILLRIRKDKKLYD